VYHTGAASALGNPALMPEGRRGVFTITHNRWIASSDMHTAAACFPAGPVWITLDARMLELNGFELRENSNPEPLGVFALQDVAAGISVAARLNSALSAGVALRRVHEKIYNRSAGGYLADFGLHAAGGEFELGPLRGAGWQTGLVLRNLGHLDEFLNEDPLPPGILAVAAGFEDLLPWWGRPSRLLLEYRFELKGADELKLLPLRKFVERAHLHLGGELRPLDPLALRAGWMTGYEDRGFTWGFGLVWRSMRLDYANLPFDRDFSDTHKFTFSFPL